MNLSKTTHITTNMAIKVTNNQHLLTRQNLFHQFIKLLLFIYCFISLWTIARYCLPNCIHNISIDLHHSITKPLSPETFFINQSVGNYYTHTPFCFTTLTPKKFKTISNHFSTLPFRPHFLQTANINTTSFHTVSDIWPQFSNIDPTFQVENQISNCTSGDFPIIRAQVHSIFRPGFRVFFLTKAGDDSAYKVLWGVSQ